MEALCVKLYMHDGQTQVEGEEKKALTPGVIDVIVHLSFTGTIHALECLSHSFLQQSSSSSAYETLSLTLFIFLSRCEEFW
jgi:hypothetical protein